MVAEVRKFLFETEFGAKADAVKQRVAEEAREADLAAARQDGYARGVQDGQDLTLQSIEQHRAMTLAAISDHLTACARQFDALQAQAETGATEIAVAVARKLAGSLLMREPLQPVIELVTDCIRNLTNVPHLVVRVNDVLLDDTKTVLERLARERGFEGRLVILAEPDIAPGDCRIEWANGGMERSSAEIDANIAEAVARFMGARSALATSLTSLSTDEASP